MTTEHRNSSRPVLFLIDGNSQVYRAYHAIRGLTGPDGRSTGAVYGFVAMLRKLMTDQRPDLIACAFDLAGPTFRSEMAADYKANRAPMPDDLVAQIPYVHRACRGAGRPDPLVRGVRGRRRDRDRGGPRRARGLPGGDRHRRQGHVPAGRRRRARLQPAGRRDVVRRRGREGEVRRVPRPRGGRAVAHGRRGRQHQGGAGRRREGGARPHHVVRVARRRARPGRRGPRRRSTASRCSPTRTSPVRAASWRGSGATRRSSSTSRRSATGGRTSRPASNCSASWGSGRCSTSSRPRRTRSRRTTRSSTTSTRCARLPRNSARPAGSPSARSRPPGRWSGPTWWASPSPPATAGRATFRWRTMPSTPGRSPIAAPPSRRCGRCSRTRKSPRSGTT